MSSFMVYGLNAGVVRYVNRTFIVNSRAGVSADSNRFRVQSKKVQTAKIHRHHLARAFMHDRSVGLARTEPASNT